MSIRIKNNRTGRTIIIKNQDDMNNLDTSVSSVNDSDRDFTLLGKEPESDDAYTKYTNMGVSKAISDMKNREAYRKNNNADLFDLDSYNDDIPQHYIDVVAYPLSKEVQSWDDDTVVDSPIMQLKNPDNPEEAKIRANTLAKGAAEQTDDGTVEDGDEFDFDFGDDDEVQDDEMNLDFGDGEQHDEEEEGEDGGEDGDADFQGNIRTVRGACLVFKRKDQNGTYEELWVYNIGQNLPEETRVRKAILSGTDIDPNKQESDDGQQKASTWTIGNLQYLKIDGLVQ